VSLPLIHLPAADRPVLSRVGLGSWVFGGIAWGSQDDRDSVAAILRAIELGVNWIDTSSVYGGGRSERVVGEALRRLPAHERPLVFTKVGIRIDSAGDTYRDLSPAAIREDCESSLQRLGLECLDLYQVHWPVADADTVARAWETLCELRREGKIRWAGVSNFEVALMERCVALGPIESVQPPLSLIHREAAADIIPWAQHAGAWVLVYSPLESGLLTGRFSPQRLAALPAGDWRRRREQFQPERMPRGEALVQRMRPIAQQLGASLVELAIAWTLSWPGVSGAIAGARTPAQVESWARAGELHLGEDVLDALADALVETQVGAGPMRPPDG
jgi:aryl-alcohol dehydrogenase-like predicted oxidoreductase